MEDLVIALKSEVLGEAFFRSAYYATFFSDRRNKAKMLWQLEVQTKTRINLIMSYHLYLFHPEVKRKSLQDKLPPDEFEHPKLTAEQISYFKTRLEAYQYQENNTEEKMAEYEKNFGKSVVIVSIYEREIAFSIPYSPDSEEAIFEALMTASEINDTHNFGIYNPQEGTWDEG